MSYEKQTWVTGDVITAAKLNHMENGIESSNGGAFVITVTATEEEVGGEYVTTYSSDKTLEEIKSAYASSPAIICKYVSPYNNIYIITDYSYLAGNEYDPATIIFTRTTIGEDVVMMQIAISNDGTADTVNFEEWYYPNE